MSLCSPKYVTKMSKCVDISVGLEQSLIKEKVLTGKQAGFPHGIEHTHTL